MDKLIPGLVGAMFGVMVFLVLLFAIFVISDIIGMVAYRRERRRLNAEFEALHRRAERAARWPRPEPVQPAIQVGPFVRQVGLGLDWSRSELEYSKAYERSLCLLKSHLTEKQWDDWRRRGSFIVTTTIHGQRRRFRLSGGWVHEEHRFGDSDRYCIQPWSSVPSPDAILARKLLLETYPDLFFEIANKIG